MDLVHQGEEAGGACVLHHGKGEEFSIGWASSSSSRTPLSILPGLWGSWKMSRRIALWPPSSTNLDYLHKTWVTTSAQGEHADLNRERQLQRVRKRLKHSMGVLNNWTGGFGN